MSQIKYVDTDGNKSRLLPFRYFGLDNYPAGGDIGRVYIGTGSENIPLAKKAEMLAVDEKADVHIARVDNPHDVTKAQVGLSNADNTSDNVKNVLSATKWTTARTITLGGDVTGSVVFDGSANVSITTAVADNSHNHTIANITSLQTTLNAKANQSNTYTKTEVDGFIESIDASEISYDGIISELVATNVQDAIDEVEGRLDVVEGAVADANLTRADKYLASQNIAKMVYTNGDLTKIQYKNATDVDYEVFSYSGGDLSGIAHYVGGILKGNSVLLYTNGDLTSVIFTGV